MEASLRTRSCRCTREDERKHRLIARRLSPACAQTLSIVVDRGSDQVRAHTAFRVCWHAQLLNCLVRRTGDLSPRTRNASKPSSRTRSASKPRPRTPKASKPSSRTRSASKPSPRTRKASKRGSGEFICPECGRSFARAAALGAHRRSAHGITGASSSAARARANTASVRRGPAPAKTATAARSRAAGRPTSVQPRRPRRTTADGQRRVVNRDALLRSLFPNGIPATEQALQQVNAWLEQAERLTRLR